MAKRIVEQVRPILAPRSVAVIGASNTLSKWGGQMLQRLLQAGYKGAIYPINPREAVVQQRVAYPSVLDVPDEIDLAVITVPAELVPQAMRDCVKKGIKGAIVISADFAETGSRGRALQEEITYIARQGGLRFIGPNCMGIMNASNNLNTLPVGPPKGSISFVSQSGSLTNMLGWAASQKGYGISKLISVGNQADLDVADFLEYLADDPETEVIGMYLEGLNDGRKLFQVAREMAGRKPVILYKAGRNPGSARVAMSHTAAIIGEDRVFDAMCRQAGFIRADHLFDLLDMAAILTQQPLPNGNRVGIEGTGGLCVVLADLCMSMGMEVPELRGEDVSFVISGVDFPPHAPAPRNPVDFAGTWAPLMGAKVLNRLAQLDCIDGVITSRPITFRLGTGTSNMEQDKLDAEIGELLAAIPKMYGKPVVLIAPDSLRAFGLFSGSEPMSRALDAAGILAFSTPEAAARAMYALVRYAEIKRKFAEEQGGEQLYHPASVRGV